MLLLMGDFNGMIANKLKTYVHYNNIVNTYEHDITVGDAVICDSSGSCFSSGLSKTIESRPFRVSYSNLVRLEVMAMY